RRGAAARAGGQGARPVRRADRRGGGRLESRRGIHRERHPRCLVRGPSGGIRSGPRRGDGVRQPRDERPPQAADLAGQSIRNDARGRLRLLGGRGLPNLRLYSCDRRRGRCHRCPGRGRGPNSAGGACRASSRLDAGARDPPSSNNGRPTDRGAVKSAELRHVRGGRAHAERELLRLQGGR
ncbi:hypothetical protein ACHAXT_000195, partial [Thalassiosira profunda]